MQIFFWDGNKIITGVRFYKSILINYMYHLFTTSSNAVEITFLRQYRLFFCGSSTSLSRGSTIWRSVTDLLRYVYTIRHMLYICISLNLTNVCGFNLKTHLSEGSKFDFQKYIERALEKDFGVVVGMRYRSHDLKMKESWIYIFINN